MDLEMNLEITNSDSNPVGEIKLNGAPLHCRALTLKLVGGELPQAEIVVDLLTIHSAIDSQVQLYIPPDQRALLIQMGWVPPKEN